MRGGDDVCMARLFVCGYGSRKGACRSRTRVNNNGTECTHTRHGRPCPPPRVRRRSRDAITRVPAALSEAARAARPAEVRAGQGLVQVRRRRDARAADGRDHVRAEHSLACVIVRHVANDEYAARALQLQNPSVVMRRRFSLVSHGWFPLVGFLHLVGFPWFVSPRWFPSPGLFPLVGFLHLVCFPWLVSPRWFPLVGIPSGFPSLVSYGSRDEATVTAAPPLNALAVPPPPPSSPFPPVPSHVPLGTRCMASRGRSPPSTSTTSSSRLEARGATLGVRGSGLDAAARRARGSLDRLGDDSGSGSAAPLARMDRRPLCCRAAHPRAHRPGTRASGRSLLRSVCSAVASAVLLRCSQHGVSSMPDPKSPGEEGQKEGESGTALRRRGLAD